MFAVLKTNEPRIALACSGLGDVRRGYERYFEELYLLMRGELPAVLFRGGEKGPGIRVPRISRKSTFSRIFTSWDSKYKFEVLSFGVALLPPLLLARFDLLHFSDYSLGAVGRLPKWLFKPALLFTNGAPCSPETYSRFDYIHLVNPVNYHEALSYGIPENRLFMIPHGVDTERFQPVALDARERLREAYGIPLEDFVVLSVGYMGEGSHKRLHWLIQEVAEVNGGVFLFLVGEQDRSSRRISQLAEKKLGRKVKIMTLPDNAISDAYNLADLFVLCSLREAFGIVIIEAMASGLPVVVHDDAIMRWIVGDGGSVVDMAQQSGLVREVRFYMDNDTVRQRRGRNARKRACQEFSWIALQPRYLAMYRICCNSR